MNIKTDITLKVEFTVDDEMCEEIKITNNVTDEDIKKTALEQLQGELKDAMSKIFGDMDYKCDIII